MDALQAQNKQRIRNLPIPRQVNHYILQNYGLRFYNNPSTTEKATIMFEAAENLKKFGHNLTPSEIERRLKNMKSQYKRKKEDLDMKIINNVEWEYFDELDSIFKELAKQVVQNQRNSNSSKVDDDEDEGEFKCEASTSSYQIVSPKTSTQASNEQPSTSSMSSSSQIQSQIKSSSSPLTVPKVIVKINRNNQQQQSSVKIQTDLKKRKIEQQFIKLEEINSEIPVNIVTKRPMLTSANFTSATSNQIPFVNGISINPNDSKEEVIKKIIDNLKNIDVQRLQLNYERLQLEVRRNDLDKIGYQLSETLNKLLSK